MLSPEEMKGVCFNCHEKMEARPKEQRQIEVASHSGEELCTRCCNPHSPGIIYASLPQGRRGDSQAGKLVTVACSGCHGESGMSVNPAWPNLAGQNAGYLASTLKSYQDGSRIHLVITSMRRR